MQKTTFLQGILFLSLAGGSCPAGRIPQKKINQAIDKGVDYLLRTQYPDGSFKMYDNYPVGSTALAMYTLLKCGLAPDHQAVRRAEAYILTRQEKRTYTYGCVLLALQAQDPKRHKARIFSMARELLSWQRAGGLWAYPTGSEDFSNSQYGLLGLWAASKAGFKIPLRVLKKAAQGFAKHQKAYGGWCYRPFQKGPVSGSMTAAGGGSTGLILKLLKKAGAERSREAAEAAGHLSRALRWFAEHFTPRENWVPPNLPKRNYWLYYYLYGVERLGAFAHVEKFGKHNWYWEGAEFLVKKQSRGGFWGIYPGSVRDTCFALLFLRRATAPVTDYNPNRVAAVKSRGGDFQIRVDGRYPVTMWVSSWPDRLKDYYAWGDDKLRISWIEWRANGKRIARITGSEKKPLPPSKATFAHREAFKSNGVFQIQAFGEVVDEGLRRYKVKSNKVRVKVDRVLTPEFRSWLDDQGRNLLLNPGKRNRMTAKASSQTGGWAAAKAVDGIGFTGWACSKDDERPWLEITLERPVRATHLVLSPTIWFPTESQAFKTPKLVVARIGRERFTLKMPQGIHKTRLEFGKRLSVKRIYLIILDWYPGKRWKDSGGFAEVELQDRERHRR